MTRNKISTTVYITEEQDQKLKELSRRTKVPVAVYVREGIDIVIRQYGDVLPGQLSLPKPRGE
jgi:predicted DNA-binding protein